MGWVTVVMTVIVPPILVGLTALAEKRRLFHSSGDDIWWYCVAGRQLTVMVTVGRR